MVNKVASAGERVLVIGGCGFVGLHVTAILKEYGENVREIIVYDLRSQPRIILNENNYKRNIDGPPCNVTVRYITGDIRDIYSLRLAAQGCSAVIHLASIVDTGTTRLVEERLHSVQVEGTRNVIQVCIELGIEHLVYTSTTEHNRTAKERIEYTEEEIDTDVTEGEIMIFAPYSNTKMAAEHAILKANGTPLLNGKTLHTIAIRPCLVYGEGDPKCLPTMIKGGKMTLGLMPIVGSSTSQCEKVYVGNVAWAHVHALNTIRKDTKVCGLAYIITDGSSRANILCWAKPILNAHNIKLLNITIPVLPVVIFIMFIELIVGLLRSFVTIVLPATSNEIYISGVTTTYCGDRARVVLGYTPLISPKVAYQRAVAYYKTLTF